VRARQLAALTLNRPVTLPLPAVDDFDPAAAAYVALVAEIVDPIARLTSQRDAVNRRCPP
jgi:hypothetical protein